jgi:hypothetical protein
MAGHREGFTVGRGLRGLESFIEVLLSLRLGRVTLSSSTGFEHLFKWYNNIFIYMNTLYKGY